MVCIWLIIINFLYQNNIRIDSCDIINNEIYIELKNTDSRIVLMMFKIYC